MQTLPRSQILAQENEEILGMLRTCVAQASTARTNGTIVLSKLGDELLQLALAVTNPNVSPTGSAYRETIPAVAATVRHYCPNLALAAQSRYKDVTKPSLIRNDIEQGPDPRINDRVRRSFNDCPDPIPELTSNDQIAASR